MMNLVPDKSHWIRTGGLPVLLLTIVCSGVIYNRNLHAVPDQSYLHVFTWQLLSWLPWAVIMPISRHFLGRGDHRRWPWAVASFLVGFACTIWYILVSSLLSPYREQPLTMFGLYKWWLIFWFFICVLLFWAQVGFQLLSTLGDRLPATAGGDHRRLAIWHSGNRVIVDKEDITWIKAKDFYARICLENGEKYWVKTRLNQLMQELEGGPFLRVHRSAIVNLDHLSKVDRNEDGFWEAVLSDGSRIRISRAGRAKLEEAISTIK